jgi:hypothetical protein
VNIVSYSLYGTGIKYLIGALKNAELVPSFYPKWKAYFYVSPNVPIWVINSLQDIGAQVFIAGSELGGNGMFWRFQPILDIRNQFVLIRDVDSRITLREVAAVNSWIDSGSALHIMRDHPQHNAPILGGMWGVKPVALPDFSANLIKYQPKNFYGEDQQFLHRHVYSHLNNNSMIHDSIFKRENQSIPFPTPRMNGEYVGEPLNEHDQFDPALRTQLLKVENSSIRKFEYRLRGKIRKLRGL